MTMDTDLGGAMGLKIFDHRRIDKAEIAQLVILYNIFSRKESSRLIFQGGTALRWCYGGTRFSEDLDFVTSFAMTDSMVFIDRLRSAISNDFILHFGPGECSTRWKERGGKGACHGFIEYRPVGSREKIAIKIELEQLKPDQLPDRNQLVFGALPAVSYLMQRGRLRLPPYGSIIQVETPEEILSDKVRALLERPYIKGRDFHDLAFLVRTLGLKAENRLIQRKLDLYEAPFRPCRTVDHYLGLDKLGEAARSELAGTLEQDLARFVPGGDLIALKHQHFSQMVTAVVAVFQDIERNGGLDLSGYQGTSKATVRDRNGIQKT
ncbi:MAG: hypothetical protein COT06_02635 [Syntrophobacteraceae bacterium CG07_land_8_20_14_0_80_61_8]|nr:MAG: hypothetical protein COT06_02635 [Syntrophobacteraceae bacterium CG07_land_8_20_14_0_80_61_8]